MGGAPQRGTGLGRRDLLRALSAVGAGSVLATAPGCGRAGQPAARSPRLLTVEAFLEGAAAPDEPVWLAVDRGAWRRSTAAAPRVDKLPPGGVRIRGFTPDPDGDWTIIVAQCHPDGPFDTCVVRLEPGARPFGRRPKFVQASCTCKPGAGLTTDPTRIQLAACVIEVDTTGAVRCVPRTDSSCTGSCALVTAIGPDGTETVGCACV